MLKSSLSYVVLALAVAASAQAAQRTPNVVGVGVVLTARPDSGATKGLLRVEWVEQLSALAQDFRKGELRVYRAGDAEPRQTIPAVAERPASELSLEFVDLNGDGFQDLVFNNANTGNAGAAYGADVFIWVPKLQRFVISETLSQAGELSPGRRPNCVKVKNKCSSVAWSESELCFNQANGRWRTVADSGCRGAGP